jgi:hypothetical protein
MADHRLAKKGRVLGVRDCFVANPAPRNDEMGRSRSIRAVTMGGLAGSRLSITGRFPRERNAHGAQDSSLPLRMTSRVILSGSEGSLSPIGPPPRDNPRIEDET